MFQYRSEKIDGFGRWDLETNFSRRSYVSYLHGVQRRIPKLRSSFDVSCSRTGKSEWTSQNDTKNVVYNYTLYYGTS